MKFWIIISILITILNYALLISITKEAQKRFDKDYPNASPTEPTPVYQKIRSICALIVYAIPIINIILFIYMVSNTDAIVDNAYNVIKNDRESLDLLTDNSINE